MNRLRQMAFVVAFGGAALCSVTADAAGWSRVRQAFRAGARAYHCGGGYVASNSGKFGALTGAALVAGLIGGAARPYLNPCSPAYKIKKRESLGVFNAQLEGEGLAVRIEYPTNRCTKGKCSKFLSLGNQDLITMYGCPVKWATKINGITIAIYSFSSEDDSSEQVPDKIIEQALALFVVDEPLRKGVEIFPLGA